MIKVINRNSRNFYTFKFNHQFLVLVSRLCDAETSSFTLSMGLEFDFSWMNIIRCMNEINEWTVPWSMRDRHRASRRWRKTLWMEPVNVSIWNIQENSARIGVLRSVRQSLMEKSLLRLNYCLLIYTSYWIWDLWMNEKMALQQKKMY